MPCCGRAQNGGTPLYYAAEDGHLEVVRLLLDKGAEKDINATSNVRARTRLAARSCQSLRSIAHARRRVARRTRTRRWLRRRTAASWRPCGCSWSAARTRRPSQTYAPAASKRGAYGGAWHSRLAARVPPLRSQNGGRLGRSRCLPRRILAELPEPPSAALRPQDKTPLEVVEDEEGDDAPKKAAKEAIRALLR